MGNGVCLMVEEGNEMTHTIQLWENAWAYRSGTEPHNHSVVYNLETGKTIAVCYDDQTFSNARLMAYAPVMLMHLKHAIDLAGEEEWLDLMAAWLTDAEAIIREAEGGAE
jgi:hypothetical protein